jgi:hypothetical protein
MRRSSSIAAIPNPTDVVKEASMFERELRLNGLMHGYLSRLLQDLDDAQLDVPVASAGDPPAWILAHLVVANDYALRLLGAPRIASAEWHKRFGRGVSPKDDQSPLPSKTELVQKLEEGRQLLVATAVKAEPDRMEEPNKVDFFKDTPVTTVGDVVGHLLTTHLAVHIGQLSAWRRMLGRPHLF